MGCASSADKLAVASCLQYRLGEILGEGTFGVVREAKRRDTGERYAAKVIDVHRRSSSVGEVDIIDSKRLNRVKREVKMMRRVGSHANCVRLHEAFDDSCRGTYYIIMERCGASMMDKLSELPHTSEADISRIFREMLFGIQHVHEASLVHRDVKPSNFLFAEDGRTVKLADFGETAVMPSYGRLKGICGTAPYMSPEMVSHKYYTQNTDIWSLGVTAYVLLYADFPYLPAHDVPRAKFVSGVKTSIRIGTPAPTFACCQDANLPPPSENASDFVRSLLQRDAKLRCNAETALRLPFVCEAGLLHSESSLTPTLREARRRTRKFQFPIESASRSLDDASPPDTKAAAPNRPLASQSDRDRAPDDSTSPCSTTDTPTKRKTIFQL